MIHRDSKRRMRILPRMNWFQIFERRLRVVVDEEDPYYALLETQRDEDIVWSVLRREKADDGYFNAALVAFDAWVGSCPGIKYKSTRDSILYENLILT